nr:hypothetical protein [Tanacetum cinerariifolium]
MLNKSPTGHPRLANVGLCGALLWDSEKLKKHCKSFVPEYHKSDISLTLRIYVPNGSKYVSDILDRDMSRKLESLSGSSKTKGHCMCNSM